MADGEGPKKEIDFAKLRAALRASGLESDKIEQYVLELASVESLSNDDIIDEPEESTSIAPATKAYLRREGQLMWHAMVRRWNHEQPVRAILYAIGWAALLIGAALQLKTTWATAVAIGLAVMKVWKYAGEMNPKHMPEFQRTQRERHLLLQEIIHKLQQFSLEKPRSREVRTYRFQVIELIQLFVRDHRSDLKGRLIFVNLLVRRDEKVVVIARSDMSRKVPKIYTPQQCSVAWQVFTTGTAHFTSDVHLEADAEDVADKKYRAILALPVKLENHVLGVISIDSEAAYHFDDYFEELELLLRPFVQLLAIALTEDHDRPDAWLLESGSLV
jgi:hypothetical protein